MCKGVGEVSIVGRSMHGNVGEVSIVGQSMLIKVVEMSIVGRSMLINVSEVSIVGATMLINKMIFCVQGFFAEEMPSQCYNKGNNDESIFK